MTMKVTEPLKKAAKYILWSNILHPDMEALMTSTRKVEFRI